jgi:hypothetical protein
MCVVSAVMDYGKHQFWPNPVPGLLPEKFPTFPGMPLVPVTPPLISPEISAEALQAFKDLVEKAKVFDDAAKQPHCEDPEKIKVLDAVEARLKELGVEPEAQKQTATALEEMRSRKDAAYLERNQCVALIARMALKLGLDVVVGKTAIEGWSADWHGCVYMTLPTGQVSWHFHDSQAYLFDGLPDGTMEYDGHTTPEKYERVMAAFDDVLTPLVLFGSSNLSSHLGIGGQQVQLGAIVARAHRDSGMSTNDWNELTERQREHRLVDAIADMREEAKALKA